MHILVFLIISLATASVVFISAQNRLLDMSARHYKAHYFMNMMKSAGAVFSGTTIILFLTIIVLVSSGFYNA